MPVITKTSLSKLVENYLSAITNESGTVEKISLLVQSLSGVIQVSENEDPKRNYQEHLKDKYS